MAAYDAEDWANRLLDSPGLPTSWFTLAGKTWQGTAATNGIVGALMAGLAVLFAAMSATLAYARLQCRVMTQTDVNLDGTGLDRFAGLLPRQPNELDPSYSSRIRVQTVAPLNTGAGIQDTVANYLAVAEPLEAVRVFDNTDSGPLAPIYGTGPGDFNVELSSAPPTDPGVFAPGESYLGFTMTLPVRWRVWGMGNHGLGVSTFLVTPFVSMPIPENCVSGQVSGLVEFAKAKGTKPHYFNLYT